MFKNDLFTIDSLEQNDGVLKAEIVINSSHDIFKGHFPGQPVLPGACTIEILKELIQEAKGRAYKLVEASSIKFLSMVDPTKMNRLIFEVTMKKEGGQLKINASAKLSDGTAAFKLKGVLV